MNQDRSLRTPRLCVNHSGLFCWLALTGAFLLGGVFALGAETPPQWGKPFTVPSPSLTLVPVSAGTFMMGSPVSEYGHREDETAHPVTLTKPFWLGRTPVTQAQYEAVMGNNPARFKGPDFPVETVSWEEAMTFCRKLTERERAAGRLPEGFVYTLPTEAQREYACRAGTGGRYAGELDAIAWYSGNSDEQAHAVGQKQPNAWGLFDMQGNVWEWCLDWYGDYPDGKATDPTGPAKGDGRVYRGGAWFHSGDLCRSAYRYKLAPTDRGSLLGFRVALSFTVR
jgi:formylglycine-generating enzyme required for sulfatase activity